MSFLLRFMVLANFRFGLLKLFEVAPRIELISNTRGTFWRRTQLVLLNVDSRALCCNKTNAVLNNHGNPESLCLLCFWWIHLRTTGSSCVKSEMFGCNKYNNIVNNIFTFYWNLFPNTTFISVEFKACLCFTPSIHFSYYNNSSSQKAQFYKPGLEFY